MQAAVVSKWSETVTPDLALRSLARFSGNSTILMNQMTLFSLDVDHCKYKYVDAIVTTGDDQEGVEDLKQNMF